MTTSVVQQAIHGNVVHIPYFSSTGHMENKQIKCREVVTQSANSQSECLQHCSRGAPIASHAIVFAFGGGLQSLPSPQPLGIPLGVCLDLEGGLCRSAFL